MYVYMYVCTVCMHACMYVCMYVFFMHVCMHVRILIIIIILFIIERRELSVCADYGWYSFLLSWILLRSIGILTLTVIYT
jgi:hypothetical protein